MINIYNQLERSLTKIDASNTSHYPMSTHTVQLAHADRARQSFAYTVAERMRGRHNRYPESPGASTGGSRGRELVEIARDRRDENGAALLGTKDSAESEQKVAKSSSLCFVRGGSSLAMFRLQLRSIEVLN